ncbi:MAG TPA: sugar phosphate nucleotidyltransferase [Candidatus Dormibacteraeota bacterium]|jgi:mannose-1-phosphate guanylyltransferase|nr:sugar phosphate nucleotidyltransferase [Candidatus Dormibacteraeota bacterium]
MSLHVVVLAGGSGTRLWPLSRAAVPKHLLPLGDRGDTLLRETVARVLPLGAPVRILTVATQADACRRALDGLGLDRDAVIAEPAARGTGPALGLAVRWIARDDPDAVICSVHADHHVGDDDAYRAALWAAAGWAVAGDGLVTVGLTPTYPSTGFGYVALGAQRDGAEWVSPGGGRPDIDAAARTLNTYFAAGFSEKPASDVATRFVEGGSHLWNTGLFAWPAAVFEQEMRAFAAGVDSTLAEVVASRGAGDEDAAATAYRRLDTRAVEPLLLEHSSRLAVVRADFPWSDLGSWSDLRSARSAAGAADGAGNVTAGDVTVLDSRGCLVEAHGGRHIAVVGADDLVVVDAGDALLVMPASRAQAVRDVVERLRAAGRDELL